MCPQLYPNPFIKHLSLFFDNLLFPLPDPFGRVTASQRGPRVVDPRRGAGFSEAGEDTGGDLCERPAKDTARGAAPGGSAVPPESPPALGGLREDCPDPGLRQSDSGSHGL